jgi:hypothetical protein
MRYAKHLTEHTTMFKLTSKQKSNLVTWGAFIAVMVFITSHLPSAPPNPPGFDAMDAFDLFFAGVGGAMILFGLFVPAKEDIPDVKE